MVVDEEKRDAIIKNIDTMVGTQLNVEFAGPQGPFRIKQAAVDVAAALFIRDFVEKSFPDRKVPSVERKVSNG